jgi:hypothetical protein
MSMPADSTKKAPNVFLSVEDGTGAPSGTGDIVKKSTTIVINPGPPTPTPPPTSPYWISQGLAENKSFINSCIDSAGNSFGIGSNNLNQVYIVKYDPNGALLWNYLYVNSRTVYGYGENTNMAVTADAGGSVIFVYRNSADTGNVETVVIKLAADGNFLWQYTIFIGESVADDVSVNNLCTDSAGSIFIAGAMLSKSDATLQQAFAFKITSDGIRAWSRHYGDYYSNPGSFNAVVVDINNNAYFTGYTMVGGVAHTRLVIFDATTGLVTSQSTYAYNSINQPELYVGFNPSGIVLDTAGNLYIAGTAGTFAVDGSLYAGMLMKLDTNMNVVWTQKLTVIPGNLVGLITYGLAIDTNGSLYYVGYTLSDSAQTPAFVIRYNSDGTIGLQADLANTIGMFIGSAFNCNVSTLGTDMFIGGYFYDSSTNLSNDYIIKLPGYSLPAGTYGNLVYSTPMQPYQNESIVMAQYVEGCDTGPTGLAYTPSSATFSTMPGLTTTVYPI